MVLTTAELVASLKNEVRILLHLAGKLEPAMLDYRPAPGQRSTLELLQYLTIMGPELVRVVAAGTFDTAAWTAAEEAASRRDFDDTLAELAAQADVYATAVGAMSDAEMRAEVELFGDRASRGSHLVNLVLCGCAAYRMQLFLYLKACGRTELNTMNLWGGADAPAGA